MDDKSHFDEQDFLNKEAYPTDAPNTPVEELKKAGNEMIAAFADASAAITRLFRRPKAPKQTRAMIQHTSRTAKHIVGYDPDPYAIHPGKFRGGIRPIRRRFRGVSRTV